MLTLPCGNLCSTIKKLSFSFIFCVKMWNGLPFAPLAVLTRISFFFLWLTSVNIHFKMANSLRLPKDTLLHYVAYDPLQRGLSQCSQSMFPCSDTPDMKFSGQFPPSFSQKKITAAYLWVNVGPAAVIVYSLPIKEAVPEDLPSPLFQLSNTFDSKDMNQTMPVD